MNLRLRGARALAITLAAVLPSAGFAADETPVALRMPETAKVAFRGLANFDGAGLGENSILYPAPNLVGLLAAIATHAALTSVAAKNQRDKFQEVADQAIKPFATVLDSFTIDELVRLGVARISPPGTRRVI